MFGLGLSPRKVSIINSWLYMDLGECIYIRLAIGSCLDLVLINCLDVYIQCKSSK